MPANKREIKEINAGSMADIAFLLLIFFLVATTMNVDTGVLRRLPPMPEEEQQQDVKIKERNLFLVFVSGSGDIMAGGEIIDIRALKDKALEFIENRMDDPNLPEKFMTDFQFDDGTSWTYPVSQGVISLQTARDTNYDVYMMVQNELTRAYNEVRETASIGRFGKPFADLKAKEMDMVAKAIPLKISEAEPRPIKR